jgi:hypothetical protein
MRVLRERNLPSRQPVEIFHRLLAHLYRCGGCDFDLWEGKPPQSYSHQEA